MRTTNVALQVRATQGSLLLTSAPVQIAHAPQQNEVRILPPVLSLTLNGQITASASVTDTNGNGEIIYIWKNAESGTAVQTGTSAVFALSNTMQVSFARAGSMCKSA